MEISTNKKISELTLEEDGMCLLQPRIDQHRIEDQQRIGKPILRQNGRRRSLKIKNSNRNYRYCQKCGIKFIKTHAKRHVLCRSCYNEENIIKENDVYECATCSNCSVSLRCFYCRIEEAKKIKSFEEGKITFNQAAEIQENEDYAREEAFNKMCKAKRCLKYSDIQEFFPQ